MYGIWPANEAILNKTKGILKKTIVVWLCESPPVKPQQLGFGMTKKLDMSISLATKDAVDIFVHDIISSFLTFKQHKEIVSGDLKVDLSRKAFIGNVESNIPTWYPI